MDKSLEIMPEGVRYNGNASCKIRICKALPTRMREGTRELVSLEVPPNLRNTGMATELMHQVCREADEGNITLMLFPKPFSDGTRMTQDQLIKWYDRRFGFQVIQMKPAVIMARMPYVTPGEFKPTKIAAILNKVPK